MTVKQIVTVEGRPLSFEVNTWAMQTDASVLLRAGDAVVLLTVVSNKDGGAEADFFPLTVEYRERASAAGLIPGSVDRREGRPALQETLSSRLIDRSLRPLFPDQFRSETQLVAMVFSDDPDHDLAVLSITAASLALSLSDIPWGGPVAAVRTVRQGGRFVAFPTTAQAAGADMDFVMTFGAAGVLMVEGEAQDASEDDLVACMEFAQRAVAPLLALQTQWAQVDAPPKRALPTVPALPQGVTDAIAAHRDAIAAAYLTSEKKQRGALKKAAVGAAKAAALAAFGESPPPDAAKRVSAALEDAQYNIARDLILNGQRFDGRPHDKVRGITSEVKVLPSAHGSALFTRGETQAVVSCTLGNARDKLRHYTIRGPEDVPFFLHYNFPPYSVGEARPMRATGRRELGHGMLAQRALAAVMPDQQRFPYTVRIVSDILSSNGSSSMATVCGGCLAMLDAGVPLRAPVAGVAMGLVQEGERAAILTDILGDEDHLGDMDFKVCGTTQGVTALQMDLKIAGISRDLLTRALQQARVARLHVLERMSHTLKTHRIDVAATATKVQIIQVRPERIGDVIGPGGRVIKQLSEVTGAEVEIDDKGLVRIAARDRRAVEDARLRIEQMVRAPVVDGVYNAVITKIMQAFAVVDILPGYEGTLHISHVEHLRIDRIEDVLRVGDRCMVKVLGVDDRGRIQVSRKAALNR
jgi:polyribonucleotide nucleotidyltransferase